MCHMVLDGATDDVENAVDEDILMDIDQLNEWEEPTIPFRRIERTSIPMHDPWF